MDVFHVERQALGAAAAEDALAPEVSFDAGTEFNLCFFEEGSAHGFSDDPGSVESAPAPSPPPPPPGVAGDSLAGSPVGSEDAPGASTVKQGSLDGMPLKPLKSSSEKTFFYSHQQYLVDIKALFSMHNLPEFFIDSKRRAKYVLYALLFRALDTEKMNKLHQGIELSASREEQHYVAADSNTSSSTKTIVPCKVCGDKASGYHYGVTSCEGCKGFFRRSIQKQIEYRCLRDGKCLVIRLNRNRCQYCRFKKCLAVGMSRDSVRYGRVPKRSRERGDEPASARVSTTEGECSPPPEASPTPPPAPVGGAEPAAARRLAASDDAIAAVAQAHRAHCAYTAEAARTATRRPLAPPPPPPPVADADAASSTADALEHERCWLWQHFAANVTPSVQRVVEFAKRVPGFCDLGQDDQLILIKVGFFEIWLAHVARLTTASTLCFDDGTTVTRQQLETMYDNDFATSVTQFATSLNALSLSDSEVGLFSAVVLLTADRPGLTDVKAVEHYQDRLIDALKLQIGRNHTNESQVFSGLLIKLPELRNLGTKHNAHLDWFRANWQKVALPPLFAEIFDIPKSEDDVQ